MVFKSMGKAVHIYIKKKKKSKDAQLSGIERNGVLSIAPTVKNQAKMKQKMGKMYTHTQTHTSGN